MDIVEKKGCTNYIVRNDKGQERKVHAGQVKPVYDMVEQGWTESEAEGPGEEPGYDMVEQGWTESEAAGSDSTQNEQAEGKVQPAAPPRMNERYSFRPRVFKPTRFV
jgi:hypothetical protein